MTVAGVHVRGWFRPPQPRRSVRRVIGTRLLPIANLAPALPARRLAPVNRKRVDRQPLLTARTPTRRIVLDPPGIDPPRTITTRSSHSLLKGGEKSPRSVEALSTEKTRGLQGLCGGRGGSVEPLAWSVVVCAATGRAVALGRIAGHDPTARPDGRRPSPQRGRLVPAESPAHGGVTASGSADLRTASSDVEDLAAVPAEDQRRGLSRLVGASQGGGAGRRAGRPEGEPDSRISLRLSLEQRQARARAGQFRYPCGDAESHGPPGCAEQRGEVVVSGRHQ